MKYIDELLQGHEVEWKKLGEVCEIRTGKGVTKKEAKPDGLYPIISGGKSPMDFIDTYNRQANTVTVSRVGANAGFVNYIKECFYLNDKCFSVIPKNNFSILSSFLYYALKVQEGHLSALQSDGGVPTINTTKLGSILIPLPPFSVQEEIVRILDKFTTLEAELDCRKRQYEYYRNQLLSFDMLNRGGQRLNNVSIMALGDLGEFVRGSGLPKKDFTSTGVGCIHYGQIYTYYGTSTDKTLSFVSPETASRLKHVDYGDVIVTNTSENIEDVCKAVAYMGKESIVIGGHACIFKPSDRIIGKYFAYYTQTDRFASDKRKYAKGTKVIDVSANDLSKIQIPIPSLAEQHRIVSILDKFDMLTTSISEGLPKEIELRRKQYEYYREQLLSFRH